MTTLKVALALLTLANMVLTWIREDQLRREGRELEREDILTKIKETKARAESAVQKLDALLATNPGKLREPDKYLRKPGSPT